MKAHWGKIADTSLWLQGLGAPTPAQPSENHQVTTGLRALAQLPGRDWHWKNHSGIWAYAAVQQHPQIRGQTN